jgi:hypothetical protein
MPRSLSTSSTSTTTIKLSECPALARSMCLVAYTGMAVMKVDGLVTGLDGRQAATRHSDKCSQAFFPILQRLKISMSVI